MVRNPVSKANSWMAPAEGRSVVERGGAWWSMVERGGAGTREREKVPPCSLTAVVTHFEL